MTVYKGNIVEGELYKGSTVLAEAYKGNQKIYTGTKPFAITISMKSAVTCSSLILSHVNAQGITTVLYQSSLAAGSTWTDFPIVSMFPINLKIEVAVSYSRQLKLYYNNQFLIASFILNGNKQYVNPSSNPTYLENITSDIKLNIKK